LVFILKSGFMKSRKGQLAIEYIIFISIILLFFNTVLYPNIKFSENVISDIYNISQTKQSVDQLGHQLSSIASSPGYGKRKVYFYLPKTSMIINCESTLKRIEYQISFSDQHPKPPLSNCNHTTNKCIFYKYIDTISNIYCDKIGPGYNGYIYIEKLQSGDLNVSQ
jgi:uncharacterized protein (UPF0333 family)